MNFIFQLGASVCYGRSDKHINIILHMKYGWLMEATNIFSVSHSRQLIFWAVLSS